MKQYKFSLNFYSLYQHFSLTWGRKAMSYLESLLKFNLLPPPLKCWLRWRDNHKMNCLTRVLLPSLCWQAISCTWSPSRQQTALQHQVLVLSSENAFPRPMAQYWNFPLLWHISFIGKDLNYYLCLGALRSPRSENIQQIKSYKGQAEGSL